MSIHIAFLEDDASFAAHICHGLRDFQYEVTHFSSGHACLKELLTKTFDICLLDWNLPDLSGPQIMQRLHAAEQRAPIIFLTGRDSEDDITQILLAGADDYIIKPPVMAVLHARIQSLYRRSQIRSKPVLQEALGSLSIDYKHQIIRLNGQAVHLTGAESALAFHFFMNRGQIMSRQHLNHLLGIHGEMIDTRRLDVHVSHLRKKLALNAMHGWRLTSVYQQGYRLEYLPSQKESKT